MSCNPPPGRNLFIQEDRFSNTYMISWVLHSEALPGRHPVLDTESETRYYLHVSSDENTYVLDTHRCQYLNGLTLDITIQRNTTASDRYNAASVLIRFWW